MDKATKDVIDAGTRLPDYERSLLVSHLISILDNGMEDDSLLEASLALPIADRWLVVDRLLGTLGDYHHESERDAAWDRELARRLAEIEAGTAKYVTWEEVQQRIRKLTNGV